MQLIKNIIDYYILNGGYVLSQLLTHFLMSIYGVLFAALIAIPLGVIITGKSKIDTVILSVVNILQTVPSLAMLSIMLLFFGLGHNTVIATVFVYSLLPILKNTHTGIANVDAGLIDVAKGMGMTKLQILMKIKFPLSISVIMAGIKNALVVAIGISAIGTFIGAGGLGDIISRGVNVAQGSAIIWAGAIPTALLALFTDYTLGIVEKRLSRTNYKKVS